MHPERSWTSRKLAVSLLGVAVNLVVFFAVRSYYVTVATLLIEKGETPLPPDWWSAGVMMVLILAPVATYVGGNVAQKRKELEVLRDVKGQK